MAYVRLLQDPTPLVRAVYFVDQAVGKGRTNRRDDVLLVQFFLKAMSGKKDPVSAMMMAPTGQTPLAVDGICGNQTVAYINHFQTVLNSGSKNPSVWKDGSIDPVPPGATHGAIHQRVLSMILLNTMYAGFFGQEQHSRIHADPNFPSELLNRFFVRS